MTIYTEHAGEHLDPAVVAELDRWRAENPEPKATLAQVADHVEHAREVAGVAHIGLGGDYDGTESLPIGLEDVSCYPALLAELADRGWSDADLEALTSGNILRVLQAAEDVAEPGLRRLSLPPAGHAGVPADGWCCGRTRARETDPSCVAGSGHRHL